MRECILTIDLGTTACKTVLFSADGKIVTSISMGYPTWRPDYERAEQNPADWWNVVTNSVRKLLTEEDGCIVIAIALSSQRETIVPVDSELRPLHSAILWMDSRGMEYVSQLREKYGDQIQDWTGLVPNATYSIGKILWLNSLDPSLVKKTRYFLQPKDYLLYRMSGVVATDRTLASRTMLYNIDKLDWQEELLSECRITRDQLPDVLPSTAVVAKLNRPTADEWGLPAGIPIILGGGDRACEFLGAGVQQGEAMESTGTTSNISCLIKDRHAFTSKRATCSAYVLDGYWLLEQGMSTTGAIVDWLCDLFPEKLQLTDLTGLAEKSPPGASGLITLPFFMGARAPRWNPLAEGAIIGLNLSHGKEDILRSILEGVAYELRYALQTFEDIHIPINRIRLIGGGALLRIWNQIKANIYQRQLATLKVSHAASFGAFLLAAHEMGWISTYEEGQNLNYINGIYHPDLNLADLYQYGYDLYSDLYARMSENWDTLNRYRQIAHFYRKI